MDSNVLNLLYMFGGFTVVVVIIIVVGRIDWYKFFEKRYGYNPARAKVYLKCDKAINIVHGKLDHSDAEKGDIYLYEFQKQKLSVCLPPGYPHENILGYRRVEQVFGESVARYFRSENLAPEGVFSVSALVRSDLVTKAVNSMTTSKGFPLKWLLIIGGIGVVGFVAYKLLFPGAPEPEVPVVPVVPPGVPITALFRMVF